MKEIVIEVTKNHNIKTDGKYCMYSYTAVTATGFSQTSSYDITVKYSYLNKRSLLCNLFDKDLKETKTEKIRRCPECLAAKIIN